MDYSGDAQQIPSIKVNTTLYFDINGEICEEKTEYCATRVIKVINGTIDDVCHLIGHTHRNTMGLFSDEILQSSNEVNDKLKGLQRPPGSYLVEEDGQLYGVIIDASGELKIVGTVRHVIPGEMNDKICKVVVFSKGGSFSFCNTTDFDIKAKIESGSVFGIVSLGGHVFLQPKIDSSNKMSDLVLILQNGYFLIDESKIIWTRLRVGLRIGEIISKTSTLEKGECLVSSCGGCVPTYDGYEMFGSSTAIVAFTALLDFLVSMRTVGFDQTKEEHQNEGQPIKDGEQNEMSEDKSENEENAKHKEYCDLSEENKQQLKEKHAQDMFEEKVNTKTTMDPIDGSIDKENIVCLSEEFDQMNVI